MPERHHPDLAHRLEEDDAGRDRPTREMAGVEPLVLAERVAPRDPLLVHLDDLVHEAERPLLRQQVEDLPGRSVVQSCHRQSAISGSAVDAVPAATATVHCTVTLSSSPPTEFADGSG